MIDTSDPRTRHLIERVHGLGAPALGYFIREMEAGAEAMPLLQRYADLPAEFVRALGGDCYAQPLFVIHGGRR